MRPLSGAIMVAGAMIGGSTSQMNATRLMRELDVQYRTASSLLLRIQKALESGGRLEV